jgi:hypothetical protein
VKKQAHTQKAATKGDRLSKPNVNRKMPQNPNAPKFNQKRQQFQQKPGLTEEQAKAAVMEALIEFGLVPKAKKRKVIKIE